MKQALRLLAIMAAMMAIMIMTASIASADHPPASDGGINNAENNAGGHSQPGNSNGEGDGGIAGNPTCNDSSTAGADCAGDGIEDEPGQNAMGSQIAHNPLCGGHGGSHEPGDHGE